MVVQITQDPAKTNIKKEAEKGIELSLEDGSVDAPTAKTKIFDSH
ncbi:hypothetical protein [Gottfriedia acidiceleris]